MLLPVYKTVFTIILFSSVSISALGSIQEVSYQSQRFQSENFRIGDVIVEKYYRADNRELKILADIWVYIPPLFNNVRTTCGVDEKTVLEYAPDVIVMTRDGSGYYWWKEEGTSFTAGKLRRGSYQSSLVHQPLIGKPEGVFAFQHNVFVKKEGNWRIGYESENTVVLERLKLEKSNLTGISSCN